jgi:alpha-ribazole phosphatase
VKLYLVRHAQPLVAPGLCYGASDVLCDPQVMESKASELLDALLNVHPNVQHRSLKIISSPLSRCEQLALHLCRLQPDLAYKTDEKLAEMDFGAWEMQAWDEIAEKELSGWAEAFATYRCGGTGESTGMFVQRVAKRLHESLQSEQDQLWITHAGVIRAVQWLASQPFALFTALVHQTNPAPLLSQLRAAGWPAGEVAWCRLQPWDWPPSWPQPPWAFESVGA